MVPAHVTINKRLINKLFNNLSYLELILLDCQSGPQNGRLGCPNSDFVSQKLDILKYGDTGNDNSETENYKSELGQLDNKSKMLRIGKAADRNNWK